MATDLKMFKKLSAEEQKKIEEKLIEEMVSTGYMTKEEAEELYR